MGVWTWSRPETWRLGSRILSGAFIAVVAAGCAGGGKSTPTPPVNHPATGPSQMASVTFTMTWGSSTSAKQRAPKRRMPQYIPPTARSLNVNVQNNSFNENSCLNAPGTTITIDAPIGNDSFTFTTYDTQNCKGNPLSSATVTKQIILGAANTVSAVLNGIIESLAITLSNPSPNAGVPATVNVNVAGLDADNNTIVGPGDYSTAIQLIIDDPTNSGTLTLSTKNLPNPSTSVTLTYNGGTLNSGLPDGPVASIVATTVNPVGPFLPPLTAAAAFTPKPTIYQFSIPTAANKPAYIAAGSDGNMWFTENAGNAIARITPAGVVTEFPLHTAAAVPDHIIGASDGNLWFTESAASKLAKSTTTGTITEFDLPHGFVPGPDLPLGLVDRRDGNIWYVASVNSRLGYQSYDGTVAAEDTATSTGFYIDIAAAPDNNLYYTENTAGKIGRRHDLSSAPSEVTLGPGAGPRDIILGPDGNLWFTDFQRNSIGRLDPNSFSVTGEFAFLSGPWSLTVGRDGAIWFTEQGHTASTGDKIGRVTTNGTVSEYPAPVSGLALQGIATAPDGSIWFCEPGSGANPGRIGKLVY